MASLFREIRERWIATLNASPEVQALSLSFEDFPAGDEPEVVKGARRGYVAIGEERSVNGTVVEIQLVTTVISGEADAKAALDLLDDVREPILIAFARTGGDGVVGFLDGRVAAATYAGSDPARDGQGRRVFTARHFFISCRVVSEIPASLT